MALKIEPALLQTIRRILIQKADVSGQIENGPRQIKVVENAMAQAEQTVGDAKEQLTQFKMAANEKQLQMDSRDAKIVDFESKRAAAGSNKEYQLLNDQIAAEKAANAVLSDEILEILEKIDLQEAEVDRCNQVLEGTKQETAKVTADVDARLATLRNDLELILKELEENEAQLPPDIKTDYRRIVEANGENAIAPIDDNCCGHCFTMLRPNIIDQLRLKTATFCPSCGCILYMPMSDSVAN